MTATEWKTRLRGADCAVLGFGISNRPLIPFLLSLGARLTVRDAARMESLGEEAAALAAQGVRFVTGEQYLDGLCEQILFRSPGLRPDHPAILQAVSKGALLTSEMELFLDVTPATVLGITGSDGKTTTTTLTGLLLERECAKRHRGRVFVGGNIGTPLADKAFEMTAADFAVLELSSFQLQTVCRSAHRAALTNLSPNHLNWHTDMEEYARAKANLFLHAPNTSVVINAENPLSMDLIADYPRPITWFSSVRHCVTDFAPLLRADDSAVFVREGKIVLWDGRTEAEIVGVDAILLPGKHNLENYMTAIALTAGLVSPETVRAVASSFRGVRHRLELVREHEGVRYYNSSIDSTPSRTAAALSALTERPIVICGGYDKKVPFAPLAEALWQRARAVVLTGATAQQIEGAIRAASPRDGAELPVYLEETFKDAVLRAKEIATAGDVVLLSPACASFDAFRNFEERGDLFCSIVNEF